MSKMHAKRHLVTLVVLRETERQRDRETGNTKREVVQCELIGGEAEEEEWMTLIGTEEFQSKGHKTREITMARERGELINDCRNLRHLDTTRTQSTRGTKRQSVGAKSACVDF